MKVPEIKMKRINLAQERFRVLFGKLAQSQVDNDQAIAIHRVYKEVDRIQKEGSERFLKIRDEFAVKTEDGKLKLLIDDATKAEIPDSWEVQKEKQAEFDKAIQALNEEEVTMKVRPLTPSILKGIKVSAMELEVLGDLFVPENGPGLPGLHAV